MQTSNRIHRGIVIAGIAVLSTLSRPSASAAELKIATVNNRAPYTLEGSNQGIETELVTELLREAGHTVSFVPLTLPRASFLFESKGIDGILTGRSFDHTKLAFAVFLSDPHLHYHNHVITLEKSKLKIDKLADLGGKQVIAFEGATKVFGGEFATMAAANPQYSERPKTPILIHALFTGRTDAIVSDINIFKYYRKQASDEKVADVSAPVVFHPVFPKAAIYCVFRDEKLKNDYNTGLGKLRAAGKYDLIFQKHEKAMSIGEK